MIRIAAIRSERNVLGGLTYILLVVLSVVAVGRFVWGVLTSLKNARLISAQPLAWLPDPLTLDNYARAFQRGLGIGISNSVIVALASVVLSVGLAALTGYALARVRFRYSNLILFSIIAPQFVPGLVNLVPTYIVMARLGLLDTHAVLILLYTVHSLQFLIAITMTSSAEIRTLPVAIYLSITDVGIDWGALMASATLAVAPIAVLFVFLQQRFISGLTAGALKG
jgi:ABC-type glycerol-3-phosphate transport system permease component